MLNGTGLTKLLPLLAHKKKKKPNPKINDSHECAGDSWGLAAGDGISARGSPKSHVVWFSLSNIDHYDDHA
jgi:hypothetical protein